jgi:hypothetical protein
MAGTARVSPRYFSSVLALILFAAAGLLSANTALASIVQCGASVCSSTFSIDFNGMTGVGGGELLYDASTGDISLNLDPNSIVGNGAVTQMDTLMWMMPDGSTVSVNSLSGNADPVLGFSLGASTAGSGATFALNLNLPIALSGPIAASSSVSYSLTSTTSAGAQIAPLFGNVVTAQEVDTSVGGLGNLDKGVNVGDTFGFTGGPLTQNSPVYTASNTFTGDLAYDLMSVTIAFSLSADSNVGISGFVSQTPVPVPAAIWLFGSGLIGLVGVARRRAA